MARNENIASVENTNLSDDESIYSIISTGTLRSNSKYNVAVSIHKAEEASEIKLTLTGKSYEDIKTVVVEPLATENVQFEVPILPEGSYELKAEGLRGIKFEKSVKLNFEVYRPVVCIQTDKATYKPGDVVKFRVIFLDENTRPAEIQNPLSIIISDGEKNRLKEFKNIELKKGIYVDKYQLSEQPVLGNWSITVIENGNSLELKTFEVDKYVLPKFDVNIESAKDVALFDGVIKATIRSKYTYGKNVKGKATVSIKPKYFYCGFSPDIKTLAEKTIEIDGKGEVQFKFAEFQVERNLNCVELKAVMEEDLTGNKQETTTTVQVHEKRFRFEGIDLPFEFHAGKSLKLQFAIKNVDDTPVLDTKNQVKLYIQTQRNYYRCGMFSEEKTPPEEKDIAAKELTTNIDEHGIATFEYTFPEDCLNFYNLECEYLECRTPVTSLCKHTKVDTENEEVVPLVLTVRNKKPQLGDNIEIEVKSKESIPYLIYALVGRGKLIKVDFVKFPENTKEAIINFESTFDMIPSVNVFIHYIIGKDLHFAETVANFDREFENFIDLIAPEEAELGQDIQINIKSEANSYVGLLGVDQSVLLLNTGNDLSKDIIFNKLETYQTRSPILHTYGQKIPGILSGLAVITNAILPKVQEFQTRCFRSANRMYTCSFGSPMAKCAVPQMSNTIVQPLIQIRKEFPESWIFEDIESLPEDCMSIKKRVPDTITSWVITGFSLNAERGFAFTKNPTTIKTFRPFFIGTNLPYSIKRGEQFSLPVLIFNYMDQDLDAEITLDNEDKEFEFVEPGDEDLNRVKHVKVSANNAGSLNFLISPKVIGEISLKITASSSLAGDAVHKKLKVEPEGITVYKNKEYYLQSEEDTLQIQDITEKLYIAENAVPDSEFIAVSVMGNLLSSTITNIDKLVRMPYGCGEQNMVNFVPNILVLWYLESIQELNSMIEEKAKHFLEIGYQRELTYKHNDGSYSAFGKSDKSGSTWLTAYVMRSFHQAKKYIAIDMKILEDGLDFLAKTQSSKGCFPEVGRVVDFSHMNEFGLTAFVLLAFLENTELIEKHMKTIQRGFDYLQQVVDNVEDIYALSIALCALQKRQLSTASNVLTKLEALAIEDGGRKWWEKVNSKSSNCWHQCSQNVEITGYILMTLLEMNNSVLPIVKWLISQRNSNGGFESTQETVVGLWALIKFAEKSGLSKTDMRIKVSCDGDSKTFEVNKENSLIMQTWELPKNVRDITFSGDGLGTSILQISYQYNILEKENKPSFKINTKVKPKVMPSLMAIDVSVEYTPLDTESQSDSNMVVMEVALPSGYVALPETFKQIRVIENVKRVETKNGETIIIVYFDSLKKSESKCIPIEAELTHTVVGQKPVPIVIYDYYDNQRRATDFYQINECDANEECVE